MYTGEQATRLVNEYLRVLDVASGNAALKMLSIVFEQVISEGITASKTAANQVNQPDSNTLK